MHPKHLAASILAFAAAMIPVIHVLYLHISFYSLQNQLSAMLELPNPIPSLHQVSFARVAHVERLAQYYAWKLHGPNNDTTTDSNFKLKGIPAPTSGLTVYFCVLVFTWYIFLLFLIVTSLPEPAHGDDTPKEFNPKLRKFRLLQIIAVLQIAFLLANVVVGLVAGYETREGFFTPDTPTLNEDPTAKDLDVAYTVQELFYFIFGVSVAVSMWTYIFLAKRDPDAILRRRKMMLSGSTSEGSSAKKDDEALLESTSEFHGSQSPILKKGTSGYFPESILESRTPRIDENRLNMEAEEFSSLLAVPSSPYNKPIPDVEQGPIYNPHSMLFDQRSTLPSSRFEQSTTYVVPKPKLEVEYPKPQVMSPTVQTLDYPQSQLISPITQTLDFPQPTPVISSVALPNMQLEEYPQSHQIKSPVQKTQSTFSLQPVYTRSQQNSSLDSRPQTLNRSQENGTNVQQTSPTVQNAERSKSPLGHKHRLSEASLDPSEVVAVSVSTDYKYTPFSVGGGSVVSEEFDDNDSIGPPQ